MNTQYDIQLNYSDLSRSVALNTILSDLEKIDIITDEVYNKINGSLLDKKSKLENIKSRLFRISTIFQTFEKLTKAITIKSAKYYPSKIEDNSRVSYKSLYYEDVNDFTKVKHVKYYKEDLNSKPLNAQNLGRFVEGNIDDLTLNEELLKCLDLYNSLTRELDLIKVSEQQFKYNIEENTKIFTGCFDYFTKTQVYGGNNTDDLSRLTTMNQIKDANRKTVKQPTRKRKIEEEAPNSLVEKSDPSKYTEEKHIIRRATNNIDFQFRDCLDLGGIAEIDLQTNHGAEDYFNSNTTKKTTNENTTISNNNTQNNNFINDDIQDFQTPLEIYKSYNITKKQQKLNNNINNNTSTYTPTPTNTTNQTPSNQQTNNTSNYNSNNNNVNSNTSYNQSNTISSVPSVSSIQQAPTIPSVPSVPSVPNVPSIPSVPKVPTVPTIPNIPSVPNIPSAPLVPKVPAVQNVPVVNNIPTIPTAVNPTVPQVKKEETKKTETGGGGEKRGALLDEIRNENPMARLKKVPTGNVENTSIHINKKDANVSNVKKEPPKAPAANPHDLLKQAIGIRFMKLNKNKRDSSDEDSD